MPGKSAVTVAPQNADAQLVRAIGYPALTANIVNSTIGAGIFALPAVVAAQIGAAAPLAYLICAGAMCLFVSAFAMAGSRVSLTGGLYAYVEVAFGSYFGFLAGALYFLTAILAISGIVSLTAASVGGLIPALATPAGRFVVTLAILLFLVAINVRGVSVGARAVEAVTILKLAPLLIFIVAGIFFLRPSALAWPGWPPGDNLGRSVLQLLFAFVGVEVALMPSGEVKNPARTVPRAIFTALGLTTVLYIAIQFVAQGSLGPELGSRRRRGSGPGRRAFSGKRRPNPDAHRSDRFRLRLYRERHPQLAAHHFRVWSRRLPAALVRPGASTVSHAIRRHHYLRGGRVRPFLQLLISKTRCPLQHGGAVALHSLLPRRSRLEAARRPR